MSLSVLGIDIAKQKFDAALLVNGKTKHKTCKNSAEGFEALNLWLQKQGIQKLHACMEATGNYGEDLAIYLHDAGHIVSIVNPARIKGFAQSELVRTKTDKLDAALIARFCLAMKPGPWIPPAPEIRSLRALVRRVDSLVDMRTQEKNRINTAHESANHTACPGQGGCFCIASLSDLLYGFVSSLSGQQIPMKATGIVHCYLLDGGSITRFQNIIPFDIIGIA